MDDWVKDKRKFDRQFSFLQFVVCIIFLVVIAIFCIGGYCAYKAYKAVDKHGLKNVATRVWDGPAASTNAP